MNSDNITDIDGKLAREIEFLTLNMPETAEKICGRCGQPFIYRVTGNPSKPKYCLLCVRAP